MTINGHVDRLGATEAVLIYHLHLEEDYLRKQLLHSRWYPPAFHRYLTPLDEWQLLMEPATAPLLQFHVRVSLHGRLRLFKPDFFLHRRILGLGMSIEAETTCSWHTVAQVAIYSALSMHLLLTSLPLDEVTADHVLAVQTFVLAFDVPPLIRRTLTLLHARVVDLLDDRSPHFLAFPERSPLGMLQIIITREDDDLLQNALVASNLTSLNKLFIVQNVMVHGSDVMKAAVEELERKKVLDLDQLEREASKELPPPFMRYFTPEQIRGLTPEQVSALTPEQLKGLTPKQLKSLTPKQLKSLTPEQLKGLTPKQLAAVIGQLTNDADALRMVFSRIPSEARRQLLMVLQELERDNDSEQE